MNELKGNDGNFRDTVRILEEANIDYWLCHGTLLGLVRENRLLPWDHDIDIGLIDRQGLREVTKQLFETAGFSAVSEERSGSEEFVRSGGRRVDVNFYKRLPDVGAIGQYGVVWRVRKRGVLFTLLFLLTSPALVGLSSSRRGKFLYRLLSPLRPLSRWAVLQDWAWLEKGYSTPAPLLENFVRQSFMGINCRIPADYEGVLAHIYGENWRKPIQDWDWELDSETVHSKS